MRFAVALLGLVLLSSCYNLDNPLDPKSLAYTAPADKVPTVNTPATGTIHIDGPGWGGYLDYGTVPPNEHPVIPIRLRNWGAGPLTISSVTTYYGNSPVDGKWIWSVSTSSSGGFLPFLTLSPSVLTSNSPSLDLFLRFDGTMVNPGSTSSNPSVAEGEDVLNIVTDDPADAKNSGHRWQTAVIRTEASLTPAHITVAMATPLPAGVTVNSTTSPPTITWTTQEAPAAGQELPPLTFVVTNTGDYSFVNFHVENPPSGFWWQTDTGFPGALAGKSAIPPSQVPSGTVVDHRPFTLTLHLPTAPGTYSGVLEFPVPLIQGAAIRFALSLTIL